MPENKYLWRASVRGIARPIYLVAQNMASAQAQAANNPQVAPKDVTYIHRIDVWNEQQNRTVVIWPEPPPEPEPEPNGPP